MNIKKLNIAEAHKKHLEELKNKLNPFGGKQPRKDNPMNEILDAQDKIATARNLNDAVLMSISNHGLDAKKIGALQALSLIIDDTLIQAREVLETYQRVQPRDRLEAVSDA